MAKNHIGRYDLFRLNLARYKQAREAAPDDRQYFNHLLILELLPEVPARKFVECLTRATKVLVDDKQRASGYRSRNAEAAADPEL